MAVVPEALEEGRVLLGRAERRAALEEALERYKGGVGLLKGCRERLAGFRAQVEELTADGVVDHAGDPDVGADLAEDGESMDGPMGGSMDGLDTPF